MCREGVLPTLCKSAIVAPGAAVALTCAGKFGKRATFLVDHDGVALTPGTSTATAFATASVAADALPGFVRLFAYAPVSGAWSRHGALVIGATPVFALDASNGWSIAAGKHRLGHGGVPGPHRQDG